ncbi:fructosamine kinase family protein [Jiella sp. MQZ9-1]|uniref:Fructosamine kinase family protein n=1 Tax=Jiella flava TaxID=2816857 RepID=A0A939FSM0_9HYPH|nr:fructosamine kinase family protein [Jiella flava]MBO0661163.1 fructosamine kinase family protein [Jiella flava]MCD2469808.1 fructosamine kinase family protein [Jiella flava]
MSPLANRAAALLGGAVASTRHFAGGSLSSVEWVRLADGREMLVKSGPAPEVEARMLRTLGEAGVPVPQVLAADDQVLAITRLADDCSLSAAWGDLGAALRRLHAKTAVRYGFADDYAFARLKIVNRCDDDWPRFYAENRLLAAARGTGAPIERRVEALCARLHDRLPKQPRASLLHGDLWSGNVLTFAGRVSGLIDPAAYYGDGEIDIAMLGLFARPSAEFFEAYGPLPAGHHERAPIYALWPALVHLNLFGSGYRGMVEAYLAQAGF